MAYNKLAADRHRMTAKYRETRKRWKDANRPKLRLQGRDHKMRAAYGITLADYERLLLAQGGKCAICARDNPGRIGVKRFPIDHDHATGKVRALLCVPCNLGIGMLGDSPALLRAAAAYVETHAATIKIA